MDDFVLSARLTNAFNGLLHFTEDTNVALVPIKFAPAPYSASNFPPTLIFSNNFNYATQGIFAVGKVPEFMATSETCLFVSARRELIVEALEKRESKRTTKFTDSTISRGFETLSVKAPCWTSGLTAY